MRSIATLEEDAAIEWSQLIMRDISVDAASSAGTEVALDVREARVVADASHRLQQRGGGGEEERGKTKRAARVCTSLMWRSTSSARWMANREAKRQRRAKKPKPSAHRKHGKSTKIMKETPRALTAAAAADEEYKQHGAPARSLTHTAASTLRAPGCGARPSCRRPASRASSPPPDGGRTRA